MLLVASAWLFGSIAEDVVTNDRLTLLDERVAQWLHLHASVGVTRWMLLVSQLHSPVALTCYTSIVGFVAYRKRQWRVIWTLALCVGGGMLLNVLMKLAFHRARPYFTDPIVTLTSFSFPSGHVAASTIFYGLGVVWVFGRTRALTWRVLAVIAAALAILLVALSRMYLGVHYLSDVSAAFAEAVAWLAICLTALAAFWRTAGATPDALVTQREPTWRESPP
ncbi:MAG: phosphatase PAP2 family protein [Pseudomonadota bacterium]